MYGDQAIKKLLRDYEFETVLDVGSGAGEQAAVFRAAGKKVTTVDCDPAKGADFTGDYSEIKWRNDWPAPFDLVWCCHTLEHQHNPQNFLWDLKIEFPFARAGILAITVPPYKLRTVPGHLTLWTPGLLLYHLICVGIDCSQAAVKGYGYNISVIVEVGQPIAATNRTAFDEIAQYFPVPVERNGFELPMDCEVNW